MLYEFAVVWGNKNWGKCHACEQRGALRNSGLDAGKRTVVSKGGAPQFGHLWSFAGGVQSPVISARWRRSGGRIGSGCSGRLPIRGEPIREPSAHDSQGMA